MTALREAIADALDRLSQLESSDPLVSAVAVANIRRALEQETERADDGGPLTGWTAASLTRALVDGNGPRDPQHPIFAAFEAVERARAQTAMATGRVPLISRTTVRQILEGDPAARGDLVRAAGGSGVLIPMIDAAERQVLPLMRSADGTAFVASFSERSLLDEWVQAQAAGLGIHPTMSTLDALATHVREAGAGGIVINPLNESLAIPVPAAPARVGEGVAPVQHPLLGGASREQKIVRDDN